MDFILSSLPTWVILFSVILIPTFIILLPSILSYITPNGRRVRKLINQIPGPPSLPILGHARTFFACREKILEFRQENSQKFYPLYKLWFLQHPMVNLVGPEYAEAILRSSKHIEKGRVYKFLQPWLGEGLLTSGGEKWFSHRKTLTPAFHFKILEEFVPLFVDQSAALVDKLSLAAQTGEVFDVVPLISRCTLEIICESAMGIRLDPKDQKQSEYIAAIYEYGEVFYRRVIKPWYNSDLIFNLSPLAKQQDRILKVLHSFTESVIKDKKREYIKNKGKQPTNLEGQQSKKKVKAFLELLIELSLEENLLNDLEIREEVDTFMFEGHDTTSMAICWSMFTLANNPDIQDQVLKELETVSKENGGSLNPLKDQLPLLERCIKETLRLYPSVPFISRVLKEDFRVEKYLIPEGTMVNIIINEIHRNPKIYPEPDKFDPNRFLPEATQKRHPYAYVPFSAGPRNCIGQRFAMIELKSVLAALVLNYKIIALQKPEDIKYMHDIVLRPSNGIDIKLERRDAK